MKIRTSMKANNLHENVEISNRNKNFLFFIILIISLGICFKIVSNYQNTFITSATIDQRIALYGIFSVISLMPFLMLYILMSKLSLTESYYYFSIATWVIFLTLNLVISYLLNGKKDATLNISNAIIISLIINVLYILINLVFLLIIKNKIYNIFKKIIFINLFPLFSAFSISFIFLISKKSISYTSFNIFANKIILLMLCAFLLINIGTIIVINLMASNIRKKFMAYRIINHSKLKYELFFVAIWLIFPLHYFKNMEIDISVIFAICAGAILSLLSIIYIAILKDKIKFDNFIIAFQTMVIIAISLNLIFMNQESVPFKKVSSAVILCIGIIVSYIVISISDKSYTNKGIHIAILLILSTLFILYLLTMYMIYLNISVWFMIHFISIDLSLIVISLLAIYILWIYKIVNIIYSKIKT